jgi:hypothetical protein
MKNEFTPKKIYPKMHYLVPSPHSPLLFWCAPPPGKFSAGALVYDISGSEGD